MIVTAAAIVVIFVRRSHDETGAAANDHTETAWQHVMDELPESGRTTVEMAREAFSLAFEPLPGADVPSGTRDEIQSGSAALRMMIAHWSELSDGDRQTVLSYLPDAGGGSTPTGDTIVKLIGYSPRTNEAGGPDEATKGLIERRVGALRAALGGRAGALLIGEVELSYNTRDIVVGSAAYSLPHTVGQVLTNPTPTTASLSMVDGDYSGCFVALNRSAWSSTGTDLDFVLAHELYHCFEAMFIGDLDVFYDSATAPAWVIEGGANWAAAQVVPTSNRAAGAWHDYLLEPWRQLFRSSYDAIGFWNHLDEVSAIDTWAALRGALGKPSAGALAATEGGGDAFLDSWASSLFRQPAFGHGWQTNGPTMSTLQFAPEAVTVDNGSRISRTALSYSKTLLNADVAADVVVLVGVGHVTLHNAAHDESQFGQLVYCGRDDGCECPPGSVNIAPSPAALGGRSVALGVTGSDRAAAVALGGISIDEWCKTARPPVSRRPSSGAGTGGTGTGGGAGSLCHQIVEREGIDGLLNYPSMSPQDIQDCVAEILANSGLTAGTTG